MKKAFLESTEENNQYLAIDERHVEMVCANCDENVTCVATLENLNSEEFCMVMHNACWDSDGLIVLDELDVFQLVKESTTCNVYTFTLDPSESATDSQDSGEIRKWLQDKENCSLMLVIEGEVGLLQALGIADSLQNRNEDREIIYSVISGASDYVKVMVLAFPK